MSNAALLISATIAMYIDCAVKAVQGLIKNWLMLGAALLAVVAFFYLQGFLAPLGMAGGMVLGLIEIAFLTYFYSWVSRTVRREKMRLDDYREFDVAMFFSFISVAFIIWLVEYAAGLTALNPRDAVAVSFVRLGIVVLFNALPETVYINRIESIPALQESASFTFRNWVEWYLPFIIIICPWILSSPNQIAPLLALTHPLLPVFMIVMAPSQLIGISSAIAAVGLTLVGFLLANWFMVFRGHLFIALQSGSRRQRVFEARQK